jgi:hypothetical protein
MARIALIGGRYMGIRLARGAYTVVTVDTALAGDGGVIKHWHQPIANGMAHIAGLAGGNMVNAFTRGNGAVVAALAGSDHLGMINPGIDR